MNRRNSLAVAAVVPIAAFALAACSGGSSDASTDASAGQPTGAAGGGDNAQMQQIQECLSAAGIDLPTGGGAMPSGAAMPSGGSMPTDMPTDMPSGMPTDMPTDMAMSSGAAGMPSGGAQGGGNQMMSQLLEDEDAQAALTACGIDVSDAES